MAKLSKEQIAVRLKAVPDWSLNKHKEAMDTISRTYQFKGFPEGIQFVVLIAADAEEMDHHPDIDIRYDKVTLALSTHSEKGLTENDFKLAGKGDQIFARV